MASSPIVENSYRPSFSILSGGSEIPSTYEVISINIEQEINKIAEAEIVIRDGDASEQTFDATDSDTFKPGTEIEIKLGYEDLDDSVFKGIVVKQLITINDFSGSRLKIICRDKALKTIVSRKNIVFENMKDSDIISQIAGTYGLSTTITDTTVLYKEMVQFNVSDWDFMLNRAELNGMVLITDSGTLVMAVPDVSDEPVLQVQFGYDIIEFDGEIDATYQYSAVEGNSWDMSTQSVINASAAEPTVNTQGDMTGTDLAGVLSAGTNTLNASVPIEQASVQAWADATLLKSRLSRFKGTLLFQGSALAKPNTTIQLSGLSERFNGNAFISGVNHRVDNGKWNTEVKIGMHPEGFSESRDVSGPIASGLLPGVKGLQTGIVKKTYEDPDNQFRVQVEIPLLGSDANLVWARLSSFYTGNSFGAYFMPEVNDEVILGFMNDDPRFPIILGSLYSSSIPAPQTPDEKNTIKTILTQSNLQVKFDDENKVLSIITPGGNTIVLSDQDSGITITDQNNNTIQMNSDGITIDSKSNLTLKAAEGVTINGATITTTGTESVSVSGGTISVSGDETVSISGSSECSVSSDGELALKGATVMVN
ncbi:MAG TPA: type VI secretion system tip protein VgrG [Cytophagaceae bacterium]|jgi:Rhs element Vgr protein|nr:type VI secretion system tip protein VgrG [Cytophagaceae bacterium]